MHQCTHCQADLADNAQFCSRCGTSTEESQTRSANLDEVDAHEEDLETTSKQPAVTIPATPSLPTLRTRRMHPNPSISEFPRTPWLPAESASADESIARVDISRDQQSASSPVLQLPLTPPIEIIDDFPQTQAASDEPEASAPTSIARPDGSFQAVIDTPALSTDSTATPDEISTSPTGELAHVSTADEISAIPTGELEQVPEFSVPAQDTISATPTSELAQTPAYPVTTPDEISASPTGDLVQTPASSASGPDEVSAIPTSELKYISPFPPPTPERRSTPRPASTMAQPQRSRISSVRGTRAGRTPALIVALIMVLLVLAGGAGAFALVHQSASAGASAQCNSQQANCSGGSPAIVHGKPTRLTFSGSVAGPMTIVAKPRCQLSTAGNLRVLTVNLSGTINSQLYNFSFVIEHYNGPGTYSSAASTTILFDVPGQSTTNGWGNSAPTDNGSIIVDRSGQAGSISYTLSGVGNKANTQIQATGNWTCDN